MNRRDFLKMIGVGLTSLGLGKFAIEPVEEPVPTTEAEETYPLYTAEWLDEAAAGSFSGWSCWTFHGKQLAVLREGIPGTWSVVDEAADWDDDDW